MATWRHLLCINSWQHLSRWLSIMAAAPSGTALHRSSRQRLQVRGCSARGRRLPLHCLPRVTPQIPRWYSCSGGMAAESTLLAPHTGPAAPLQAAGAETWRLQQAVQADLSQNTNR